MTENMVQGPDLMIFGLTSTNELVSFNSNQPQLFTSKTSVTGITSGEKLLSIDFRPSTGELYALSNASRLYIINTSTASARAIGTTAFSPPLQEVLLLLTLILLLTESAW